ncbi:hypothetical protein FRB97_000747, partial [Tulasnella sp. 331]
MSSNTGNQQTPIRTFEQIQKLQQADRNKKLAQTLAEINNPIAERPARMYAEMVAGQQVIDAMPGPSRTNNQAQPVSQPQTQPEVTVLPPPLPRGFLAVRFDGFADYMKAKTRAPENTQWHSWYENENPPNFETQSAYDNWSQQHGQRPPIPMQAVNNKEATYAPAAFTSWKKWEEARQAAIKNKYPLDQIHDRGDPPVFKNQTEMDKWIGEHGTHPVMLVDPTDTRFHENEDTAMENEESSEIQELHTNRRPRSPIGMEKVAPKIKSGKKAPRVPPPPPIIGSTTSLRV